MNAISANTTRQPRHAGSLRAAVGFTLVELLVVVSIIAILISLLLPALRSARHTAYTAKGLANQRQIMLGVLAYAQMFRGHFPPGDYAWTAQYGNSDWSFKVNGFIAGKPITNYAAGTLNLSPVFQDPNATIKAWRLHYSAHTVLMPNVNPTTSYTTRSVDKVRRPSQTAAIMDATQQAATGSGYGSVHFRAWAADNGGIWTPYSPASAEVAVNPGSNVDVGSTPSANIRFRQANNTAANMGFVDGHADTMKMAGVKRKHVRVEPE